MLRFVVVLWPTDVDVSEVASYVHTAVQNQVNYTALLLGKKHRRKAFVYTALGV